MQGLAIQAFSDDSTHGKIWRCILTHISKSVVDWCALIQLLEVPVKSSNENTVKCPNLGDFKLCRFQTPKECSFILWQSLFWVFDFHLNRSDHTVINIIYICTKFSFFDLDMLQQLTKCQESGLCTVRYPLILKFQVLHQN